MLAFHREDPSLQASLEREAPPATARNSKVSKVPLPVALLPESLVWSIPWAHHIILMEKVKDLPIRRWYMEQTLPLNTGSREAALEKALTFASAADPFRREIASVAVGTSAPSQ